MREENMEQKGKILYKSYQLHVNLKKTSYMILCKVSCVKCQY